MRAERILSAALIEEHPEEAVAILEAAPARDAARLLEDCSAASAAAVLEWMETPTAAACLLCNSPEFAARVLAVLPADSASRFLRAMPMVDQQRLLALLDPQISEVLQGSLRFPDGTAGSMMDPSVFPLPEEIDAREAQRRIRSGSRHVRNYAYVTDRGQSLSGVVHLRDLLLAKPGQQLREVMRPAVERVTAAATQAAIAGHPGWRRFRALPVVDESNRVVGVLRREALKPARVAAAPSPAGWSFSAIGLAQLAWTMSATLLDQLFSAPRSPVSRAEPQGEA